MRREWRDRPYSYSKTDLDSLSTRGVSDEDVAQILANGGVSDEDVYEMKRREHYELSIKPKVKSFLYYLILRSNRTFESEVHHSNTSYMIKSILND